MPWRKRHARGLRIAAGSLAALVLLAGLWMLMPTGGMTPQQVEVLVQKVLDAQQPAPTAADAYESILPSVVHVRGLPDAPDADVASGGEVQSGTGVVIVDTGVILTNLHVVNGSKAIKVVFHDGLESDAIVTGVQP
ncbi:MAG TPA: peptidase S1, partial [Burkholderiales bacterium]|nr:peptidase S1 [Burkholderiales bacterium]